MSISNLTDEQLQTFEANYRAKNKTAGGKYSLRELVQERMRRQPGFLSGPELFTTVRDMGQTTKDGFVSYGEAWSTLRPEIAWGLIAKKEMGYAMGRLTYYCVTNNLPIMSVLLVNGKNRAMTEKAMVNIYSFCKDLDVDVGTDVAKFITAQIELARSFRANVLPGEAA